MQNVVRFAHVNLNYASFQSFFIRKMTSLIIKGKTHISDFRIYSWKRQSWRKGVVHFSERELCRQNFRERYSFVDVGNTEETISVKSEDLSGKSYEPWKKKNLPIQNWGPGVCMFLGKSPAVAKNCLIISLLQ